MLCLLYYFGFIFFIQNVCACPQYAASSGGPGVGTGAGELADPHGGGGG